MKRSKWFPIVILALLIWLLTPISAHADTAPPEQPTGADIVPGQAHTQVRMVAETVTLTVPSTLPGNKYPWKAATVADFTMRNLGAQTETMQARFPLTFWTGQGLNAPIPEITDIQIFVNGVEVPTQRIEDVFTAPDGTMAHDASPWAAFNVTFLPDTDLNITVKYTTKAYDDLPFFRLRYILETGAGWNGTIGSADITIKLPYQITDENVFLNGTDYYASTPGMQVVKNEIRWHLEDFEPTRANNIAAWMAPPDAWQKVLNWRAQTQKTPNDGEAWGQLGLAIKRIIVGSHEFVRSDETGLKLYEEAVQAYQKSVMLLPKDALWHYGFAELLWSYYDGSSANPDNMAKLSRVVSEVHQSLALDHSKTNIQAQYLADWISQLYPWAIVSEGEGVYDYPLLTATPTSEPATATATSPATSTSIFATNTPPPEATSTPQPQTEPTLTPISPAVDTPVSPTKTPKAGLPLCGGVGMIVLPALAVFWLASKRKLEDDL